MIGRRFGAWEVIGLAQRDRLYKKRWLCRCECGTEKSVDQYSLTSGDTVSCGCTAVARRSASRTTHGLSRSKVYGVWAGMKNRCFNPRVKAFKYYGARGITVCDKWNHSFEAFLADMGDIPFPGAEIDRIDNDKDYCPGNCKWSTRSEQARNTSVTPLVLYEGQLLPIPTIAERIGMNVGTFHSRRHRGWSVERIMSQPVRRQTRR